MKLTLCQNLIQNVENAATCLLQLQYVCCSCNMYAVETKSCIRQCGAIENIHTKFHQKLVQLSWGTSHTHAHTHAHTHTHTHTLSIYY